MPLLSSTGPDMSRCVTCGEITAVCSQTLNGPVCFSCIPYNLSRPCVIDLPGENYERVLTSNAPDELFTHRRNEYNSNLLVRGATITGKTITHMVLYVTTVTFENCHFEDVTIGCIAVNASINLNNCTGSLNDSRVSVVTCTESDLTLHNAIGTLTCFNSTVTLTGERLRECNLKNSHITASTNINAVLRTNIDSTIAQPPVVRCFVCEKTVVGERTERMAGKIVHHECVQQRSSSAGNDKKVGDKTDGLRTFSIELELNDDGTDRYDDLMLDLLKTGCIRKGDGTVTDEFNTPIFNNEEEFLKYEKLFTRAVPFVTESARTHIHIGVPERLKHFCYMNPMIFDELTDHLNEMPDCLCDFFGCSFSMLCPPSVSNHDRFHWINVCSHYQTLECRLAQLCSWKQYLDVVRFYRLLIKHIHSLCVRLPEYRHGEKIEDSATLLLIQDSICKFYIDFQTEGN